MRGGKGREEGGGVGGAIQCLASGRHRLSCATGAISKFTET